MTKSHPAASTAERRAQWSDASWLIVRVISGAAHIHTHTLTKKETHQLAAAVVHWNDGWTFVRLESWAHVNSRLLRSLVWASG